MCCGYELRLCSRGFFFRHPLSEFSECLFRSLLGCVTAVKETTLTLSLKQGRKSKSLLVFVFSFLELGVISRVCASIRVSIFVCLILKWPGVRV